jgi:hypothetical protein
MKKAENATSIQAGIAKPKTQEITIMKESPITAILSEPALVARDGDGAALKQDVFSRRHLKQPKKTLPRMAVSVQSKTPTSNTEVRRNEGETEKHGFSAAFW